MKASKLDAELLARKYLQLRTLLNWTFEELFRRLLQNLLRMELPEHLCAILAACFPEHGGSTGVLLLLQETEGNKWDMSATKFFC